MVFTLLSQNPLIINSATPSFNRLMVSYAAAKTVQILKYSIFIENTDCYGL